MRICLLFFALMCTGIVCAQPGSIFDPAVPAINPMDPNGDGYITSTGTAFSGPLDVSEFELPFIPFPQYESDPGTDNQYGPGCEFYELVNDPVLGAGVGYYYYHDPNGTPDDGDELMIFRFRLARFSPGSTGFSILIDTDYRFGFTGPEADVNAVPGNPGFEREVAAFNSTGSDGGVRVFNVDGRNDGSVLVNNNSIHSHYQVSYALNQGPTCSEFSPVFVDLFFPFSALGVTSTTQIRMAIAVNEDPKTSLGGGASDIGGVSGVTLPNDDDQFIVAVTHFAPIAASDPSNQAPLAVDASFSLDENTAFGSWVYAVSASDPNGDVITYSITAGNIGSAFAINSTTGEITVNNTNALDAETTSSFILVVRSSDGKLYDNAIVTIDLNDLNEHAPSLSNAMVSLDENSTNGHLVYTVQGTDDDVTAELTYSITGGDPGSVFFIDGNSGAITVNNSAALDFETVTSFVLSVSVSDGIFADEATLTINLKDVNESPSLDAAALTLNENTANGTIVHTAVATDPDEGAVLDYSFTSGNTKSAFAIDNSGAITVNDMNALDFETTPNFTLVVRVSDGSFFTEAIISIDLVDVNEPPSASDATVWVDEHAAEGTVVHIVQGMDPDADTELKYMLTAGNDNEVFFLDPETGALHVNNSTLLDFETTPVFTLSGIVSDGFLQDDFSLEVKVNDVNEPPSIEGEEFFLDENAAPGVKAGVVTGSDPDDGNILTYSITDGNIGDTFSMNSTSGEILVNQSALLDFETHPTFTLTVTVDDGSLSASNTVVVNINDLNEPPSIDDAVITVNDLLWRGDLLTTITGRDPDSGDVLSYTLVSGNEELIFSFDPASGTLSVLDALALFERHRSFELLFSVTDRAGLEGTGTITIDVRRIPGRDDIRPSNGFSPNGDGTNDFWFISGIEAFPENVIRVFNRWGLTVFETRGYNNEGNAWRGEVKGTAPGVETTYFFVIHAGDFQPITGYLILKP